MKAIFPTGDYHTMRSVLAMFSIFSIALAYLVGAQLGTRLTGAFAAFVVAVDPDLIHWVSMLLTETNFFFLLFAFLAALLYAVRKDTARSMALAGALLGVCCLQRPIPMFLAILIPAFLVIRYRSGRRLVQGAVFFLACVAMISPWTIRTPRLTCVSDG